MQRREVVYHRMGLTKGQYFHSSFFCMAAFNLLGPLFGLPFVTGSLPHSPQMVNALSENSAALCLCRNDRGASLWATVNVTRMLPWSLSWLCTRIEWLLS